MNKIGYLIFPLNRLQCWCYIFSYKYNHNFILYFTIGAIQMKGFVSKVGYYAQTSLLYYTAK